MKPKALSDIQSPGVPRIRLCRTGRDYQQAVAVTEAYVRLLDIDLSYQDIDREWQSFRVMYGPPTGCFMLAGDEKQPCGGVALRYLEPGISEMKRLYVAPAYQSSGVGSALCHAVIAQARDLGYEKMRLDTLGTMDRAQAMYARLGFEVIDAYRFSPDPHTRFMELRL